MKRQWTVREISWAARMVFERAAIICPNTYFTGFEADLLIVRRDLRLVDVEIKTSRADLKRDIHKDKWLEPKNISRFSYAPRETWEKREWPRMIWKHYFALPADIWTDELLEFIPPKSGILLIKDGAPYGQRMPFHAMVTCKRHGRPNKNAKALEPESVMKIAMGLDVRYWDLVGAKDQAVHQAEERATHGELDIWNRLHYLERDEAWKAQRKAALEFAKAADAQ